MAWKDEQEQKRNVENFRVFLAIVVALIALVLASIIICGSSSDEVGPGYAHGLLAASIATAIVAAARALEGPDPSPESRRRSSFSPANQMARSWLSCFIAIAAVLLLTQVIAKIDPASEQTQKADAGVRLSGTVQVKTAGNSHYVEISGQTAE